MSRVWRAENGKLAQNRHVGRLCANLIFPDLRPFLHKADSPRRSGRPRRDVGPTFQAMSRVWQAENGKLAQNRHVGRLCANLSFPDLRHFLHKADSPRRSDRPRPWQVTGSSRHLAPLACLACLILLREWRRRDSVWPPWRRETGPRPRTRTPCPRKRGPSATISRPA